MQIALFSWETLHSIQVGGVAVVVTEQAAALARKGHEVHVFTRCGHGQWNYNFIDGVHYHRCHFNLNPNFVDEIDDMCRSFVYHFFETEKFVGWFDVIHAHDWLTSNVMCWIKAAEPYKKAVLTIHSTEYGRCGNNFGGGQSANIRERERHGIYCADRVLVVSHALKNEIMWMYNVPDWKIGVIHNGINYHPYSCWIDPGPIKSSYGIGPLDPTVLFVGRMVYQKGPDLLVDAIPMILVYYPNAKFIFAGNGEMFGYVIDKAHQLGVAHATRFLGTCNGVELINLYKLADVVSVPSRNEPFGLVILEAWSAGKPVVATNSGGPGEIVWHDVNGLRTHIHPESIAWGIGNLFKNFEHARWMGRNGRIAVESAFSWDHIGDEVLRVYHA